MWPIRLFWRRKAPRGLLLLSLLCAYTLGHADNLLRADNGQDWSDMEAVIAAFLPGSDWQRLEPEALASTLRAQLGGWQANELWLPEANLGPLQQALLLVASEDAATDTLRYHLRYARVTLQPEAGVRPYTLSLLELHRVVLPRPPAAATAATWRFIHQPIMGHAAALVAAARRQQPTVSLRCLGQDCLRHAALGPALRHWPEPVPVINAQDATLSSLLDSLFRLRQLVDEQMRWRGFEAREGVADGEVFVELLLEQNLHGDALFDLTLHEDRLMDHLVRAHWQRLVMFPGPADQAPLLFATEDQDAWGSPQSR